MAGARFAAELAKYGEGSRQITEEIIDGRTSAWLGRTRKSVPRGIANRRSIENNCFADLGRASIQL
jgi:hypothetical protein